jgi:hypothetical protein
MIPLGKYRRTGKLPEDYRKLCSIQALPTSYLELSGTLLLRGHCYTYPPN